MVKFKKVTLRLQTGKDEDQVIVEVGILIQLLKFLKAWSRKYATTLNSTVSLTVTQLEQHTHTHTVTFLCTGGSVKGYLLYSPLCGCVWRLRVLQELQHLLQSLFIWLPLHPVQQHAHAQEET